jgi:virginiamycin B lyase
LKHTLVLAGAVIAAFVLGGCGHTYPVTSGSPTPAPSTTPFVRSEYAIPTANSQPAGITKTSSSLFFTERAADKIGVLGTAGTITEYTLPEANSQPLNIILGQDGNIWLTEFGNDRIAQFNLSTTGFTECTLPIQVGTTTPTPFGIAAGADGNLWVTDPASNGIWRVAPGCGSYAFFPLATANAGPQNITVGSNGALWFTEYNVDQIGEIFTSATAGQSPTEFKVSAGAGLGVITSGSDNAIWFTETKSVKIGRMLTTGQLSSETALTGVGQPYGIVNAPDGNFYIADQTKSNIVQFNPTTGAIALVPTKTANAGPYFLAIGPDLNVYFTQQTANSIGQLQI